MSHALRFRTTIRLTFHTRKGRRGGPGIGQSRSLGAAWQLRTHRASYRKLHQSPRHWAPDHPGGRRWEKKFTTSRAEPSHYADLLRTCADSSRRRSVPSELGKTKRSLSESCTGSPAGWDCISLPSCSKLETLASLCQRSNDIQR